MLTEEVKEEVVEEVKVEESSNVDTLVEDTSQEVETVEQTKETETTETSVDGEKNQTFDYEAKMKEIEEKLDLKVSELTKSFEEKLTQKDSTIEQLTKKVEDLEKRTPTSVITPRINPNEQNEYTAAEKQAQKTKDIFYGRK
jgi:hypothetical protein